MADHTAEKNHQRLEKMSKWAQGVNADLKEMKQAIFVTTCDRADAISLELAELRGKRQDDGAEWRKLSEDKARLSGELSEIKQAIDGIEAPVMLAVSMELDESGKKFLYSNKEAREAAVIVALQANENYHELLKRKREIEQGIGRARAVMESLDREAKEYGRAVDVLTARLNNLTARVA